MPCPRILVSMLAALLIAQSALGAAWHRCHENAGMKEYSVISDVGNSPQRCHDSAISKAASAGADHTPAPHGICSCAIAHCAPALVSRFDFTPAPVHPSETPHYHFAVSSAPPETLLRPPTFLS